MTDRVTDEERIARALANVTVEDCGYKTHCWIFGDGRERYQSVSVTYNQSRLAHRFFYEWHKGPIPNGMQLDHLCRIKPCVNPDHLEPVTAKENYDRSLPFRDLARRGRPLLKAEMAERRGV